MGTYCKLSLGYELSFHDLENNVSMSSDRVPEVRYQEFIDNVKTLAKNHANGEVGGVYHTNHSFLLTVHGTIKGYGDDRLYLQIAEQEDGMKLMVSGKHRYTPEGNMVTQTIYVPLADVLGNEQWQLL